MHQCFLCEKDVSDGDFCYGCKEYICDDCSGGFNAPMGSHSPDDHEDACDEEDD